MRRRLLSVPSLLSFGIAGAFVFFLATRFDVDWGTTWDTIRGINPWLYLLGLAMYYLNFAFRGLRWRVLAHNAQPRSSPAARLPSALQCSNLILIGWFVNSVAWLRLGDAYRAYAFSEDSGGRFSWSLGTILAERVLDTATVLAVLVVSVVFLTTTTESSASRYVLIGASTMAFVLTALIVLMKTHGARLARLLPVRFEAVYHRFHQGTLGSFKQLPLVVALGLVAWGLEIARLYFVIRALGLSVGLPLVPLVALGHSILTTVPTPGGVGAVEPGVTGLLLLSLERHAAVSVTAVDRSITYLSVIAVGGLIFLHRQVTHARRRRASVSKNASECVSHDGKGTI